MIKAIEKLLQPVKNKVTNMIILGISKIIDDSDDFQLVSMDTGGEEEVSDVQRVQEYGLTSFPPDESETVLICPSGSKGSGIIVSVGGSKYRIKNLNKGEVAIYTDLNGDGNEHSIILKTGKIIDINGTEIKMGNTSTLLKTDGVLTGKTINPFTGTPYGILPGSNTQGGNNSLKIKAEFG